LLACPGKEMKKYIAFLISIFPASKIRVILYRLFFGYNIRNSRIGFGTIIVVESFNINKASIGKFCQFYGPMKVEIFEKARIGNSNIFSCGFWTKEDQYRDGNFKRHLIIGNNTLITRGHYFDLAGSFFLGDNSWIAGYGSQFWTHGAGIADRDIKIGRGCYIGSAVRFAPGSSIGNFVLVGMGSVVLRKINIDNAVIAGVPATIKKENYNWRKKEYINEQVAGSDT
jgi:acetyltransferase-like isoleucine patch superfamily enzyme